VTVLEEPANGEVYSGIGNLRGFALAEGGINRIEVSIDGVYAFDAPYGGYRDDVGQVFSDVDGAENSGFSLAYGYTNLTPGPHTITVRAVANDGSAKEATATFFVDNFHKPFIFQGDVVDISGGSASLDQTGIDLLDVLIDGKRYDLRLEWTTATQGFELKRIDQR
jgi:hypothetical protein